MSEHNGVLVLEDGSEFPGLLFGAPVSAATIRATSAEKKRDAGYGEAVFNTSLTGYQEILTDPSYYGQIVCMTAAHIGNTGVNGEDAESARAWCAGFVVHERCDRASNWRSEGELDAYLREHGIPGLSDVDTRALTLHLRSRGVSRGVILPASEKQHARALLEELPGFEGRDLIGEVTAREPYPWKKPATARFRVVAMDFGIKWNLLRSLERLDCAVEVVPARTPAAEILARKPDGVFLSNGPGDPSAAPYAADTVQQLIGQVPIFGVCMGHQILALASGARTYKLKFGHRGGNQPVIDRGTGHVEISSHNHGYAVDGTSLPDCIEVTHLNLNDRTIEGMALKGKDAFSVQYHPEACPGPHDSMALFDRFIALMQKGPRNNTR
ncbi:MAG: glutamine-hydrolyzing carbamoyl-phosphate synthase small subunit [Oligoflexia bacterium]|nr:glutamine-hydrolyzing carbamoyl-phosphate synthase small subunit [Oligoflexia bacterium]